MNSSVGRLVAVAVLACTTAVGFALPPPPEAKRVPVTDTYFGTAVVDPYRWMESGGADLHAYLKAHSERTRTILDAIPGRAALAARLRTLSESTSVSQDVVARHGLYFYEKLPPGANSLKLIVRAGTGGAERVLVDPDAMPGPRQAISYFSVSNDGSRVAFGLSPGGSESAVVHVVETGSGTILADRADRADYGVTGWSDDGKAFFYVRRQSTAPGAAPTSKWMFVRSYRHIIGEPASADVPVFGAGVNPRVRVPAVTSAMLGVSPETDFAGGVLMNGVDPFVTVYVAPKRTLENPRTIPWRRIIRAGDKVTNAVIHGTTVFALTAKDAPRFKVVAFDIATGSMSKAVDVIPAGTRVIDSLATASDALYVLSRENGLARITRFGYDGSVRDVPTPVNGAVWGIATEHDRPGFVAQFVSWTTPPLWYAFDGKTNALIDTKLDRPPAFDAPDLVAEEVTVPAADGTRIPLSIVHRRDMKRDGSNPTLLYGYGAYGISISPSYVPARMAWYEHGGIFAVAHVRGGGENGEEWHLAGKGPNKTKTITDFIDCAKWLIANGYTSPPKLAARGGSAGGIAVGGAIAAAPELFAAALDEIPVSDQLRIETTPNGPPNVPEFGSVKTAEGFRNLYATSPVHHLVKGAKYPAVLLTTGINDPRVDPWQAAKMAATLQETTGSGKPILLRVDFEGGHGLIGGSRAQAVALNADQYAFLLWQLGVPGFQPAP